LNFLFILFHPENCMTTQVFQLFQRIAAVLCAVLIIGNGAARAKDSKPRLVNVMILATGGTFAGTGATSTTTVGYTAATVGVVSRLSWLLSR
jgi:L-asparaginase/Glu-tRNA(Gln) amidotransferase subunit D